MFFFRDAALTSSANAYIFGDDEALYIVADNTDRIADDMLI
ncbi:hypothetical protein [Corynebacterium anserum]|nr:hypothetical protein [Corynebacterium anserum]